MSYAPIKPPPCKPNCEKRNARCHIDCPDFIKWHNEKITEEDEARKSFNAELIMRDYEVSTVEKIKRWSNR